jgi:uncharacterized protein
MSQVSEPLYMTRIVKHVSIPMSDGVLLSADMVAPKADGPFPVVFDYYPYRKDDLSAGALRRQRYLAQRGYVALRVDVRGSGSSQGVAEDEYVLQEQLDALEAIEWMARQPWSNGNVGMYGTSYGGFNSLQVAMHRPPALKAICPMYFTDNRYTDDCHYKGGAMQMLYDIATYGLSMVVSNALPPYPEATGRDWAATWEERLEHNEPWLLNWLEHQTYDDYWKHGSLCEDYEAIQCAVYLIGGWRDGYTNCNLRTFQHLRCPKKLLIGPWLHAQPDTGVPGPNVDHLHEMVRFFDYWLKGVDDGVMGEPPITFYVQKFDPPRADREETSGYWRRELDWPLPSQRSTEHALYLSEGGTLGAELAEQGGIERYTYNPSVGTTFGMFSAGSPYLLPVDQRLEEPYSPDWTSEPLDEPLEILGRPRAVLHVAVTTDVATVVVRLVDVAPDGTAALVTKGVLNLTHRESHAQPTPVVPGQVYEIAVELDATSWHFEAGHRVRLAISGADFPNTWPSPKPYTAELHVGGGIGPDTGSRLILPVVEPHEPRVRQAHRKLLSAPALRPPTSFEPTAETQSEPPVWRVTRDHLAATTEVFLRTAGHTRVSDELAFNSSHEATASVFERNPARATIRGFSRVELYWPQRVIDACARGQIESTEDAFHVTINLEIKMDGLPYASRRWVQTFPRPLL